MLMKLTINGADVEVDDRHAKTPLLWVLRDVLGMHGTKFGCGVGYCAACSRADSPRWGKGAFYGPIRLALTAKTRRRRTFRSLLRLAQNVAWRGCATRSPSAAPNDAPIKCLL
jgi:hypothetical protein